MKTYYVAGLPYSDELWHHGVKGQKWGIRRYQNLDGTYTSEGKVRYGAKNDRQAEQLAKYQEHEYAKAEIQYGSRDKALSRKISKLEQKPINELSEKRLIKNATKILNLKERQAHNKELGQKVLKNVKDMKVSDMRRERLIRGSIKAGRIIASVGALSLAVASVIPIAMGIGIGLISESTGSTVVATNLGIAAASGVYANASANKAASSKVKRSRERRANKRN